MAQPYSRAGLAANTENALRLMRAASFELILGRRLTWPHMDMARHLLRRDLPDSLLQLTQMFVDITPRLSAASLQTLLPGAQGIWRAQIDDEMSRVHYLEIIIKRNIDTADGEVSFSGLLRNVTREQQKQIDDITQQKVQAALGCVTPAVFQTQMLLLTKLASGHCPNAAMLQLTIANLDDLKFNYDVVTIDHIFTEVLRRMTAFLPDSLGLTRDGTIIKSLVADVETIDISRLSQGLTSFPMSTPQGSINAQLDINVKPLRPLNQDEKNLTAAPRRSEEPVPITESDIIGLLNQRSLSLALQPICEAKTGRLHHYEALMRIDDPVKGPQSAWRHIMAAEDLGLIHLLDYRALERAALLMIRYPEVHIALNISAGTVGDSEKQNEYLAKLDAFPALHERLTIEVTETMALAVPELAAQFAERLRARGCHLSIDDFGAGHTSFQTLMSTEASQIKLDGSLIGGICRSVSQQNFVRLMVDFAATFNVLLVAERIETAEERLLLASLGVDYLQGYYLGRPISEHDFTGHVPVHVMN